MLIDTFRTANELDANVIAELVNMAYRPESGLSGWTHESDLVSGKRTNASQVTEIINKSDSIILLGLKKSAKNIDKHTEIVACVHIEKEGDNSHISMLAVNPSLQGTGIGKQVLAYAENYASTVFGSKKFVMVVVSARTELISFYERQGYQRTGQVMDYPLLVNVGHPKKVNLTIEVLEKQANTNSSNTNYSKKSLY